MLQEQQKILSTKVQYIVKIKQNNTDILVKTFHPNSGPPHDWYYSTASNWPKKAFFQIVVYCAFCCFHNLLWMKYLYTELRVSGFQVLLYLLASCCAIDKVWRGVQ